MKLRYGISLLVATALILSSPVCTAAATRAEQLNIVPLSTASQAKENFQSVLSKSEDVGAHWFDDAVFIGDSISVYLSLKGGGEDGLGNATFLVVGCYSTANALAPVSNQSIHPPYQGVKMKTEDAIALCGAKKVYIMLGMNDIGMGLNRAIERYVKFIRLILEKTPDAQIFVQSVTPMVKGSTSSGKLLNNTNISIFNEQMKSLCRENGWYYVDVASILKDEEGYLRPEYCNDNPTMGIHLYPKVVPLWVEYLRTHTPKNMRKDEE